MAAQFLGSHFLCQLLQQLFCFALDAATLVQLTLNSGNIPADTRVGRGTKEVVFSAEAVVVPDLLSEGLFPSLGRHGSWMQF